MKSATHSRINQRTARKKKIGDRAPARPRLRLIALSLVLILLCGLGLRLRGLSHGLGEGEVYHPDTPRLMWASRVFLGGTYFFRVNHPDYDGYPYFYSHLVEYLWRGTRAITSFFSALLLGADHSGEPLSGEHLTITLFWLARLTNVVLSTLAILIVYRIAARNLDPTTGLIAAGLLALSPMNIATAHFATNDTMVCFFTIFTVLLALRICTAGLWPHYLLGGILVACAFSAKYHAGIVGLTCLLAHVLRYCPPKKALTKESLSRLALMAAAFFITFLLVNPCFLVSPGKAFHDFRKYCQYIPTAKLTASQMRMAFFAKAQLSFTRNFPVLVRSVGPIISVLAFAGLARAFFRGKRLVVLASFPALYLLLTFLSKPIQQRFYLAALLPTMFLLAAAFVVELARIKKVRPVTITAGVLVLLLAFFFLLKSSLTQVFFFSHSDTRNCAKRWASQNIPPSYEIKPGEYTFALVRPQEPPSGYRGTLFLSSSLRPAIPPEDSFLLKAFDLEEDALPTFRNPRIEIYAQPSPLLREGFFLPTYQRIPSRAGSELIFAHGRTFYQDEKMIQFGADRPLSRILVSSQRIDSAIV
ncbi:MAG: ArnT family glycosyltransferase, partial [Acidobacteriota bacterium]